MIIGNYLQELFFSSSLIVDYVVFYFVFVLWLFFCVSNGVAHFFIIKSTNIAYGKTDY